MTKRKYNVQIVGRGEDLVYSDGDLEISLQRTYGDGHRLYCDSTAAGHGGPVLAFMKRREIIENLCDYFDMRKKPSIFVLNEEDRDLAELERLFADLVSQGHKITVEYDNARKREQTQDEMHLETLRAGKKLSINGVEIQSVEDYWRWKRDA